MRTRVGNGRNYPQVVARSLREDQLAARPPRELLRAETHCMNGRSLHGVVNDLFRAELLALRGRLGLTSRESLILALGPNNYIEYPDQLFEGDYVVGLDIDPQAMACVQPRLEGKEGRVISAEYEASQVGNEIIAGVMATINSHSQWSDRLLADLVGVIQETEPTGELPIEDGTVDLYTSLSFVDCAVVGIVNSILEKCLWSKFGKSDSWDFLSAAPPGNSDVKARGEFLNRAANQLFHRLMKFQLGEARRVLRPGGLAIFTGHALRFYADIYYRRQFRFPWSEMFPADLFLLDIRAGHAQGQAEVKIGMRTEGIDVVGADSLAAMTASAPGFEVEERFSYWGVEVLGHPELGSAMYQLDNAVVLRKQPQH